MLAPTCISTLECGQALTHGSRPPEAWAVTAGGHSIGTAAGHIVEHLPHGELIQTRISKCGGSLDDIALTSPTRGCLSDGACVHLLCRVPSPRSSGLLVAQCQGWDSLHELDVPDRVRVCTACGTCSTSTGKHPKLSMETVLRRTPDCLRRHQRAEMRVAFVSACNGCKLQCEFTESRKSANRLRRCNVARRHAHRLRAATGTVTPPFYRWPKIGRVARPRQYACNDRGARNLEVR